MTERPVVTQTGFQWLQAHVAHDGDECLIWPKFKEPEKGYGRVAVPKGTFGCKGKIAWAHRTMCWLAHGAPPTLKHQASHSCHNGHLGCVNPRHLRWQTQSENILENVAAGRHFGSPYGRKGKLKPQQVLEIRAAWPRVTQRELAAKYGTHVENIGKIVRRERWTKI